MSRRLPSLACAFAATAIGSPASALNVIGFTRLGEGSVEPGDFVHIEIGFAFDDPTFGGGIDFLFDPAFFVVSSFRFDPSLGNDPNFNLRPGTYPWPRTLAFGNFIPLVGKHVVGVLGLWVLDNGLFPTIQPVDAQLNQYPAGPFIGVTGVILPVEITGGFDVTILPRSGPPLPWEEPTGPPIPEPATGALLGLGLAALAREARSRRAREA